MGKKADEYLLNKYAILRSEDYSQSGRELYNILRRLNKNKKLDDTDKKWIQDKKMLNLYTFVENIEKGRNFYSSLKHLHCSNSVPYNKESFITPAFMMRSTERKKMSDRAMLSIYAIPGMDLDSQSERELCDILYRLQRYNKLDNTDKKWIQDNGLSKLYRFVENWEKTGDPDFDFLHNTNYKLQKDDLKNSDNSKQKTPNSTNKKRKNDSFEHIRKPHMALQYKKAKLIEHIKSNLEQITPSNIPKDSSSLFLPKIWNTINESIKKDINELFRAYGYRLWTATSLMAYRIFENVLKVHIEHDLKEEPAIDITEAIKKLEKHKYDPNLIKILYELKEYRNSFMHGNTRASTQEAKDSIIRIMSLAMNIHNIKP